MRKLKLQVQISVDGYIAGPNGEMDWVTFDWDDELKEYVTSITDPIDTIVLGRNLAEGFIPHWASVAEDPDNPEHTAGIKFTETPKMVFSRKLDESTWDNTVVAKKGLVEAIQELKAQDGQDIIAYGGGEFVSSLIKEGLIDEFHLLINPVALGDGMPIFESMEERQPLKLKKSIAFDCGIVLLCYELKS
ncbi:dihydrofolate reductase family protein [Flavilitoribacter nigricans]|uniref:Deaminase n=1 Tax=Flavilitoribacter nigricans (strain ATCC 23147 / DSM 23189 / NBRC 102662 / NCIMB 1420 / SS-2) TaxID=1122177 RepID=A0A2D0NCL6_FLAN2|nr:dihydrofolate reductase family protein [Flavilitoribacter nigricans]PHN05513.1 deaminase [Flavilitoribacter nigricans DSM 23189 = NBRC 102662]